MAGAIARLGWTGLKRGVLEGSRGWLYVGIGVTAMRAAHRLLNEAPETVFEGEIKPGDAIEIRTVRR